MAVACWGVDRGHQGLQQLASLAEAGRTLLGPLKASKLVTDGAGEESALVRSTVRLLDSLDVRGAVGQLLHEAVRAQHGAHGTGAGTLLFLAGAWSRAAEDCLQMGIPVPVIASLMSEGLGLCAEAAASLHVPVRLALGPRDSLEPTCAALHPGTPLEPRAAPAPRPLSHSRHLSRARTGPAAQPCTELAELAAGLSHGSAGGAALVEAAVRLQLRDTGTRPSAFDTATLFTCPVPGLPGAGSGVCPGFVALVPARSVAVIRALERQPARVVVVEGDLTHTFRHPGFREPARTRTALGRVEGREDGSEAAWADGAVQALSRLRVDLVLARGGVADALAERCLRGGRLALGRVPGRALRAVAEASGAAPVLYASQMREACVGAGVSVALWRGPSGATLGRDRAAVAIAAEGAALVTAVLTGPVAAQLQGEEDAFWGCAHRVRAALAEGRVFPGAGAVELLCVSHLLALADGARGEPGAGAAPRLSPAQQAHRPAVLRGLAAGWRAYLSALLRNAGCSALEASTAVERRVREAAASGWPAAHLLREHRRGGGGLLPPGLAEAEGLACRVYDAVTPKLEAWRRALDLVLLVLQTDSEIITGRGRPPHGLPTL